MREGEREGGRKGGREKKERERGRGTKRQRNNSEFCCSQSRFTFLVAGQALDPRYHGQGPRGGGAHSAIFRKRINDFEKKSLFRLGFLTEVNIFINKSVLREDFLRHLSIVLVRNPASK